MSEVAMKRVAIAEAKAHFSALVERVEGGEEIVIARRGKPVILGKAGRTDAGRRAAASHTGALGGEDAACDAMLARHGVLRGDDQDELLDIAAGLVKHSLPAGRRVAVISPSGGTGVWLADACARFGLEVPEIDPERQARLRAIMPAYGSPVNPGDLTVQGAGGGQEHHDHAERPQEPTLYALGGRAPRRGVWRFGRVHAASP
jgi:antitoxin (DNA-binding transcriptional repressor) of toxin-antitoxin stability system